MTVRILFERVQRVGDVVHGVFDVRLPNSTIVSVTAFAGRSGRVVFGRGSLGQVIDRDAQNAVAGAVRQAIATHLAEREAA